MDGRRTTGETSGGPAHGEPVEPWQPVPRPEVRLPPALEEVLETFLRDRHPRARPKDLILSAEELSTAFTSGRGHLPVSYLNQPRVRSAYLVHAHALQLLRGVAALGEVRLRAARRGLWPTRPEGPLRVADLGCGLGAMSQALLVEEPGEVEITLVDHQRSAVQDARELVTRTASALGGRRPRVRGATKRVLDWLDEARARGWQQDLILAGAVWNEWDRGWEAAFRRALDVLAPGGLIVLVEPAMPEVARRLQELRDGFLDQLTTVAPCTHDARCPLLRHARDWCFTTARVRLPRRAREISDTLGHATDRVHYSLLAAAGRPGLEPQSADLGRVVSDPMAGGQIVCAAGTRRRIAPGAPQGLRGDAAVL